MEKINFKFFYFISGMFLCFILSFNASGNGVGINTTRIIYNAEKTGTSVQIRNNSNISYLVSIFLTKELNSKKINDAFDFTPPLFRLDAASTHDINIFFKNKVLPTDRETLFYFHARAIPSSTQSEGMKIGLENVIKLFYRPNFAMKSSEAFSSLIFKNSATGVEVTNSSPYFINLDSIYVDKQKINISSKLNNNIIAPFSSLNYPISKIGKNIKWKVINDLGGFDEFNTTIK